MSRETASGRELREKPAAAGRLKLLPLARSFFLGRLLREKLLLLGLILFAVLMWGGSVARRTKVFANGFAQTSRMLVDQRDWLARRGAVEAASQAAVQNLDPARTFDAVRLQAEVDSVARAAGLTSASGDDPKTERTSQFSVHSMQFTVRNASYESLVKFYTELSKRAPYIAIKQFRIVANPSNGAQLSATLRVASVEIAR